MKKIIVALVAYLAVSLPVHAQTWSEWFRQKKTQKKYLLQQIAALKVYIDYAEKGYKIACDGIHAVREIKRGDFNLHDNFLSLYTKSIPPSKNTQRWRTSSCINSK